MGIPNRQIGWGTEENLLWQISKQLEYLTKVTYNSKNTVTHDIKLGLRFDTVGPKVVFTKTNYGDEVDVIIPGVLEITRGNNQGIFNYALQESYSGGGPENTNWNSYYTDNNNYGWHKLTDVNSRSYSSWVDSVDQCPPCNIGKELIMIETTTGRTFLVKFLEWTQNNEGGGFTYERYEVSPSVDFVRPDYEDSVVDVIDSKTIIARDSYQGGIYNAALESSFQQDQPYLSPLGTEWNSQYTDSNLNGWGDLSNVRSRRYAPFREALNGNIGNNVTSTELVMHDLATDLYYKVEFLEWTQGGNGGGFEYIRTLIPLDEAIIFADKTVLTSANI